MKIAITGASGFIASQLVPVLLEKGHDLILFSRRSLRENPTFSKAIQEGKAISVIADICQPGIWEEELLSCDAVIHLAGEPILGQRWTKQYQEKIRTSRVKSTRQIANALVRSKMANSQRLIQQPEVKSDLESHGLRHSGLALPSQRSDSNETNGSGFSSRDSKPSATGNESLQMPVFISGSAIGIYGFSLSEIEFTEESPPGTDFLAEVCQEWEQESRSASQNGIRTVLLRIGIVLHPQGGALQKMLPLFRFGLGGRIASGKQWLSWVHMSDLVQLILFTLENPQVSGPVNATAPQSVTNKDFTRILARILHRPALLPVPYWLLRLGLGQAAATLAYGQRVLPKKLIDLGFKFRFPELSTALADLLKSE